MGFAGSEGCVGGRSVARRHPRGATSGGVLDGLYAKYDALVAPARATVAYPIDVDFSRAYRGFGGGPAIIPAGNLAGQPAVAVPNGFGPNNLPTGIQFTGRVWGEGRLLQLAHAYQQATDWHKKRPPV